MSKKQRRLESFGGNVQRRKPREAAEAPAPTTLTLREKVAVVGVPIAVVASLLVIAVYGSMKHHREHVEKGIERRIEKWRTEHHLTAEEVVKIREIEIEFHGGGISALLGSGPSEEEKKDHKEVIDELLKE